MLSNEATRQSIEGFLKRKFSDRHLWEEEDIQFYSRDISGNVYHAKSIEDADSVVFRYRK